MRSDFIFQKKTEAHAKRFALTPEEMAVIDLVSAGWDKREAYTLIYRVGQTWSVKALNDACRDIFGKPGARERIKALKHEYQPPMSDVEETMDEHTKNAISKEGTLKDLVDARKGMSKGTKEWLEITKMIADITRMKNDEIKTEDTTVHYYLPLRCHECELYARHREEEKNKENKDTSSD